MEISSRQSLCAKCLSVILPGKIQAYRYARGLAPPSLFHLRCFHLNQTRPLLIDTDVELRGVEKEQDVERVKAWVRKWNQRFTIDESKVPTQYLAKAVQTSSTPLRRLLLEVFQYLSMREVEMLVGLTCKAWFHVSRDSEYWKTRYLLEFQPATTEIDVCYRAKFIAGRMSSCWHCNRFLSLSKIELMCPIRKRPLCIACISTPECRLIPLRYYVSSRNLQTSLPKYLHFSIFLYNGAKTCYLSDANQLMMPYAKRRKALLMHTLAADFASELAKETIVQIEKMSIERIYNASGVSSDKLMRAVRTFLGRNEAKEDLTKNVRKLIQVLQKPSIQ